ncbi:MAG: sugar phosphate isomerase/epimerase [Ruminococcaceae bacterium]|nr:sugar phosphate isomerase/epimerase [Oscillospiraceae bacterium]
MKLSINTDVLAKEHGEKKAIDMICDAGFDALDFSFFDSKYHSDNLSDDFFRELRKYIEQKGLVVNQAHAPFPSSSREESKNDGIFKSIVTSIKNAALLGSPNIVVHPCTHMDHEADGNADKLFEINMEFYKRLIPYCEEYGIKVALENMWQKSSYETDVIMPSTCARAEEFIKYFDTLSNDCFTICLDIGHAVLVRESPDILIKKLGAKRLGCLHVHDVDAIHDLHTLPFFGEVKWDRVTKALADIGYNGDFTFEANNFYSKIPTAIWPSALKHMEATGRYLIAEIKK